jgi:hypothetical protein
MLPLSVVLLQQIHCYPIGLLRYYGNATNTLLCNRHCYVTMEMPQTHCYATATVALLWTCYRVHKSCHQGNPTCNIATSLCLFVPSSPQVRRQPTHLSHLHLLSRSTLDPVDHASDPSDALGLWKLSFFFSKPGGVAARGRLR